MSTAIGYIFCRLRHVLCSKFVRLLLNGRKRLPNAVDFFSDANRMSSPKAWWTDLSLADALMHVFNQRVE
eukprot:scaffold213642_cov42-Prasinocladus_malaysianus.AAC.1